LTFKRGQSGNPAGPPKGKPHKLTAAVRKMVDNTGGAIVKKILERAEGGDIEACRIFARYLLPRPKMVFQPVDLPPAKDAAEIQAQIARLASLAGEGALDLDSMTAISRLLAMALGARPEELEELVSDREARDSDDG
jgi:Family of unknown function (DUF5681)